MRAVLHMCKILSYERRLGKGRTARFVVDISGSRAVIEASIRLQDLRAVGIQIGHLSKSEASLYASSRMPESFKDLNRRNSVAESVVQKFDGRVLTLQRVCEAIREGQPGDLSEVKATIKREQISEEKWAARGWWSFCCKVADKLGTPVSNENLKQAVELLLEGPQDKLLIIGILSRGSGVKLNERDIGLFNADAGFHPFAIDPFQSTLSLSGTAIKTVLISKINTLGEPPSPEKKE